MLEARQENKQTNKTDAHRPFTYTTGSSRCRCHTARTCRARGTQAAGAGEPHTCTFHHCASAAHAMVRRGMPRAGRAAQAGPNTLPRPTGSQARTCRPLTGGASGAAPTLSSTRRMPSTVAMAPPNTPTCSRPTNRHAAETAQAPAAARSPHMHAWAASAAPPGTIQRSTSLNAQPLHRRCRAWLSSR